MFLLGCLWDVPYLLHTIHCFALGMMERPPRIHSGETLPGLHRKKILYAFATEPQLYVPYDSDSPMLFAVHPQYQVRILCVERVGSWPPSTQSCD